jgi:hypothetical protein
MKLYPSLVSRLANQHEAISSIIASVNEAKLKKEIRPGKWSIHENIVHLVKYQPVFIDRLHIILTHPEPMFEAYVADNDPEFEEWKKWDSERLMNALQKDRQAILQLVTALPDEKLARVGIHKKFGRLSIVQWTEFFLLHEAHHMFTIFQLANTIIE